MTLQVYGSADFTFNFAGISISADQRGPDGFASLSQIGDTFALRSGVAGHVCRSKKQANPCFSLKVKIPQTAPVNTTLSAIHRLDLATDGGVGVGPAMYKDRSGNQLVVTGEAYINKWPDSASGSEEADLEWEFILISPEGIIAGGH
jgi:hypothetical protein